MIAVPLLTVSHWRGLRALRRPLVLHGLIFSAAAIVYYITWRILGAELFGGSPGGQYDPTSFVSDWVAQFEWFAIYPLTESLSLWSLSPSFWTIAPMALLSLVSLGAGCWIAASDPFGERVSFTVTRALLLGVLIPASFGVHLISADPKPLYRTYSALTTVLVLVSLLGGFIALLKARPASSYPLKIGNTLLVLCALIGAGSAHSNVKKYFADADRAELEALKAHLPQYALSAEAPRVHVILPAEETVQERGQFGASNFRQWANIRPLVRAALSDAGISKPIEVSLGIPKYPNRWLEFGALEVRELKHSFVAADLRRHAAVVDLTPLFDAGGAPRL